MNDINSSSVSPCCALSNLQVEHNFQKVYGHFYQVIIESSHWGHKPIRRIFILQSQQRKQWLETAAQAKIFVTVCSKLSTTCNLLLFKKQLCIETAIKKASLLSLSLLVITQWSSAVCWKSNTHTVNTFRVQLTDLKQIQNGVADVVAAGQQLNCKLTTVLSNLAVI